MKRQFAFLFFLSYSLAAFCVDSGKIPPLKVYLAPRLADSVTVRNMTDPAVWKNVMPSAKFESFTFGRKNQPRNKTFFQAGYNLHGLFVAVTAFEPLLKKLDFSRQKHAAAPMREVFAKPVIELFLDPPFSRKVMIQIVSNINAETYSKMSNDAVFDHPFQVEVKPFPKENCYRTWFFVPWKETSHLNPEVYIFSMTPQANPVIGFNIGREQLIGDTELSQWNPTTITFTQPEQFGALVLADEKNIQEKMQILFTDNIIAGGLEIQGPNSKTEKLISVLLNSKLKNVEKSIRNMKSGSVRKYQDRLNELKQQAVKNLPAEQQKQLLNQVLQLNREIDLHVFESLKTEIFDEI